MATAILFKVFLQLQDSGGLLFQIPLHSSAEGIGVILAALIGAFMLKRKQTSTRLRILSCGFLGTAILDGFHSCSPPGDLFVFFRAAANLFGGTFAFLAWAWPRKKKLFSSKMPWIASLAALLIGLSATTSPESIPPMRVDLQFSTLAVAMNAIAGVFFLFGAIAVYQEYRLTDDPPTGSLVPVVSLFGISGLLFRFSAPWDMTWWFWHWLRLSSYALIFKTLIAIFQANLRDLAFANQIKTRFMDIASHELRTPLTALSLRVALFERLRRERDQPVREQDLASLQSLIYRIIRMVNELLDISRLERNSITLQLESVDLRELLAETVDEIRLTAKDRIIELTLPERTEIKAQLDRVRLMQIIENLLSNAIRYSEPGTPIAVSLETTPKEAQIHVVDRGPGISPEDLTHLFEPYFRAEDMKQAQLPGLGLGLYISKQIARLHGGDVRVVSERGVGSRFTLLLPWNG